MHFVHDRDDRGPDRAGCAAPEDHLGAPAFLQDEDALTRAGAHARAEVVFSQCIGALGVHHFGCTAAGRAACGCTDGSADHGAHRATDRTDGSAGQRTAGRARALTELVLAGSAARSGVGVFGNFLASQAATAPENETAAMMGAALFTGYLRAARAIEAADLTLGPGRFTMPGDLEGSPLLTFFPLDPGPPAPARGTLAAMLERRYDAYRARVVRPFFRDHFARLDRQIVLVDALSAIVTGPGAVRDLETTLATVLHSFRSGASHWLAALLPRRIDRILFAATKADHIHHTSHDRLQAALGTMTAKASARAEFQGAEVKALALAALQSTQEAEVRHGGQHLACIVGTPLPGERIGAQVFDGIATHRIFPGDLAADATAPGHSPDGELNLVRFQPARIPPDSPSGRPASWPHIRLDRALDFLIGDHLT